VRTALLARVAKDCAIGVHHGKLVAVLGNFDVGGGSDGNNGEEGAFWFPALGTAAGVVVEDVSIDLDLDWVGFAEAAQAAAASPDSSSPSTSADKRSDPIDPSPRPADMPLSRNHIATPTAGSNARRLHPAATDAVHQRSPSRVPSKGRSRVAIASRALKIRDRTVPIGQFINSAISS